MNDYGEILLLKGKSKYDILRVAIDKVATCMIKMGYEIIVLDFCEESSVGKLINYLNQESIEFIFSFNAILLDLKDNLGNYIFDNFNVPIVTYLVENPIYYYDRLLSNNKNLSITTFDRENVQFLKKHYSYLKKSEFIPFMGFEANNIVPYIDREIDVLFVGTYTNPKINRDEIEQLDGIFKTVANNVVEILLNNTDLSLEKAIRKYLDKINFVIDNNEFLELINLLIPVDKYIRNYFRDKVIRTVLNAGILLTVYGIGWEVLKKEYPENLIILNQSNKDLINGIELMANSKIVLSCIQESIISTMFNGAISVTDSSKYMNKNLVNEEEIVFYSLDYIEELPNKILNLLEDSRKSSVIAKNGMQKAKEYYSTENYVEKILEFAPRNYKLHAKEDLIAKYAEMNDAEIKEIVKFIKKYGVGVYNYEYIFKYVGISVEVNYDIETRMYYVMHKGKRMYYPKKYINPEEIAQNYRFSLLEQDLQSPHRYLDDDIIVKDGDVVIDAGVAEGNFSLDIIDRASKLYIIECEKDWIEALEQSFKPYKEKVVFINKFLSNKNDDYNITIDEMVQEKVDFIKMDIEGAELGALEGAQNTILSSDNLTYVICSYHRKGDENKIKEILKAYDFETSTSNGYMFFVHDEQALKDLELRRGLVRGIKQKSN